MIEKKSEEGEGMAATTTKLKRLVGSASANQGRTRGSCRAVVRRPARNKLVNLVNIAATANRSPPQLEMR